VSWAGFDVSQVLTRENLSAEFNTGDVLVKSLFIERLLMPGATGALVVLHTPEMRNDKVDAAHGLQAS